MNKGHKICIYSAHFGITDDIMEPKFDKSGVDFVLFTDDKEFKSDFFKVIYCKPDFSDPNRSAKVYKMFPHIFLKDYDYTIWVDTNLELKPQIKNAYLYLKDDYIAFIKHPFRNSIYEEAMACIQRHKDDPAIIKRQIARYKSEGYPEVGGLISGNFIIRKNKDPFLRDLNRKWWNEISRDSRRDQLSFNYVIWKYQFRYKILDLNVYDNNLFNLKEHKKGNLITDEEKKSLYYKNIRFDNFKFNLKLLFLNIRNFILR